MAEIIYRGAEANVETVRRHMTQEGTLDLERCLKDSVVLDCDQICGAQARLTRANPHVPSAVWDARDSAKVFAWSTRYAASSEELRAAILDEVEASPLSRAEVLEAHVSFLQHRNETP